MSKKKRSKEQEVADLSHRDALSRREVGRLIGCTERHVINLVKRNLLTEITTGSKQKRIPRWSLDKLLRGEPQPDTSAATNAAA